MICIKCGRRIEYFTVNRNVPDGAVFDDIICEDCKKDQLEGVGWDLSGVGVDHRNNDKTDLCKCEKTGYRELLYGGFPGPICCNCGKYTEIYPDPSEGVRWDNPEEEKMMIKRHRVNIPDMIRKEDAFIAHELQFVQILEEKTYSPAHNSTQFFDEEGKNYEVQEVPSDWLEEILQCDTCGVELAGIDSSWHWISSIDQTVRCADCWNKKDEPMDAEDYVEEILPGVPPDEKLFTWRQMVESFEAGAAENEKKCRIEENIPLEIDGPISAEEWVKDQIHSQCREGGLWDTGSVKFLMVKAFKAGEENQKLRHRATQTFEEWCKCPEIRMGETQQEAMRRAWIARGKAHGWEEE